MTEINPTSQRIFPRDDSLARGWEDLGAGVPSIIGLAKLASISITEQRKGDWQTLGQEALALLYAARDRGAYEIKAINTAFEAHQRWLAVTVEQPDEAWLTFRPTSDPAAIVRFFFGFQELCGGGFVMHQIYRDFSLTPHGFQCAAEVDPAPLAPLLAMATTDGS